MSLINICTAAILLFAAPVLAQDFNTPNDRLEPGVVYQSEKIVNFNDWMRASPEEGALLNRYPGFVQQKTKKAVLEDGSNEYVIRMYVSRNKFIVNKPANQITFNHILNLQAIKAAEPAFVDHKVITTAQVVSEDPAKAEKWGYINDPARKWCSGNVLCVQMRFNFSIIVRGVIAGYNLKKTSDSEPHQGHVDMQLEASTMTPAHLTGQNGEILKRVTGIPTPAQAGVIQTTFYASDYFEYGKVVTVVQDNPTRPGTSIVTAIYAIGLKDKMIKKMEAMSPIRINDIISGTSIIRGSRGPEKGFGPYTRDLTKTLMMTLK
ncbi:MAG: hypothetical protein K2Q26_06960 [Bdellovibrionales bacterium]|nr:hypothetical protein [Bdellovibrionales bacterium]